MTTDQLRRFFSYVDKNGPLAAHAAHLGSCCWLWTSFTDRDGYGQFKIGKTVSAHRLAFQLHGGTLIDGLELDHLCRVRNCVNPDHLEQVTPRVNVLRSTAPTAQHARKTACPQGHPYDEANTYRRPGNPNSRQCRICKAENLRRAQAGARRVESAA